MYEVTTLKQSECKIESSKVVEVILKMRLAFLMTSENNLFLMRCNKLEEVVDLVNLTVRKFALEALSLLPLALLYHDILYSILLCYLLDDFLVQSYVFEVLLTTVLHVGPSSCGCYFYALNGFSTYEL